MGVLYIFGVLLCTYILHEVNCNPLAVTDEDTKLDEQRKEPFKSICSTKCQDPETKPDNTSILYKCSCSPSCVVYSDCCYDSKYKNKTSWTETDFICISVVSRGQFRAVASCPPDRISDFCKDGIGHLPPVTSKKTGTTYANLFCATCNDDSENLVTWNIELRCSTNQESSTANSTEVSADNEGQIRYYLGHLWNFHKNNKSKSLCMYHVHFNDFSILDKLELRQCSNEKKITDCSASWTDSEVEQLCRSYEDPVYFGNRHYKNYHCAECNYKSLEYARCMPYHIQTMIQMGVVDSDVIEFCRQRGSQSCIQRLSGTDKGADTHIADMFDILNDKSCIQPGKKCCPGERYDYRSKRCKKIRRKKTVS